MLKYYDTAIVFQEVPDEISLAVNITNCPHKCVECHSPWLREDKGYELNEETLLHFIKAYPGISCICLMGGDASHDEIAKLATFIHNHSDIKVAMYSGDDVIDEKLVHVLDYYKIGSYQKDKGPLSEQTTNQRFYQIIDNNLTDITYKFTNKIN